MRAPWNYYSATDVPCYKKIFSFQQANSFSSTQAQKSPKLYDPRGLDDKSIVSLRDPVQCVVLVVNCCQKRPAIRWDLLHWFRRMLCSLLVLGLPRRVASCLRRHCQELANLNYTRSGCIYFKSTATSKADSNTHITARRFSFSRPQATANVLVEDSLRACSKTVEPKAWST